MPYLTIVENKLNGIIDDWLWYIIIVEYYNRR
jgi:hypothetical protein